jgi:hypothetical protein
MARHCFANHQLPSSHKIKVSKPNQASAKVSNAKTPVYDRLLLFATACNAYDA